MTRTSTARERLGRLAFGAAVWGAALAFAALVGANASRHWHIAIALAVMAAGASIVLVRWTPPDSWRDHAWIPYAWLALLLIPTFRFQSNDPLNTTASASSPENVVQVVVYAMIAFFVLRARRRLTLDDRSHLVKLPLIAWPSLAVASAVWSPIPLFTVVRAAQLWVLIGMALLMVRIGRSSPARMAEIWTSTLRLFVRVTTLLCVVGFLIRSWVDDRFSWPGTHPIVASMYLAMALLILVSTSSRSLGLSRSLFWPRIALFSVALYLGETRGALAGLCVGLAVVLWMKGRAKPAVRYLGVFYYVVAVALVVLVALPQTLAYLERGGGIASLTTLSGRVSLWEQSTDLLTLHGRWAAGFGYGASRVLLPLLVAWAGTAHSYWVELLLDLGIVGMGAALLDVFWLTANLLRPSVIPSTTALGLFAFTVVFSVVSEAAAFPGIGFGMLALLHVPALSLATARLPDRVTGLAPARAPA
jgi:hypothetical protein